MAKFKVGDKVELRENMLMNAPIGSTATVTKVWATSIDVLWDKEWSHNQQDGGYNSERFVVIGRTTVEDTREYLEAVTSWKGG